MQATKQLTIKNRALFIVLAIGAALVFIVGLLTSIVGAASSPRLTHVSSNVAAVHADSSEDLIIQISYQGSDVHYLEVDHSLQAYLPEFKLYADESNPYGPSGNSFGDYGASLAYSASDRMWTVNLGTEDVIDAINAYGAGELTFYFALKDADGNELWGTMNGTTPENTFTFNLATGEGDNLDEPATDGGPVLPGDDSDEDVVIPGVPNTSVAL